MQADQLHLQQILGVGRQGVHFQDGGDGEDDLEVAVGHLPDRHLTLRLPEQQAGLVLPVRRELEGAGLRT